MALEDFDEYYNDVKELEGRISYYLYIPKKYAKVDLDFDDNGDAISGSKRSDSVLSNIVIVVLLFVVVIVVIVIYVLRARKFNSD